MLSRCALIDPAGYELRPWPGQSTQASGQCKVNRVRVLLTIYLIGALLALWRTDGPPATKLTMALLWPIGPLAFVIVVAILIAASPLAFLPKARKSAGDS